MPNFHAHPYRVRAHKLRYEDVFMPEPEQPDWFTEAVDTRRVIMDKDQRGAWVFPREGRPDKLLAELGEWIAQDDEERYMVMSDTQIAAQFALIP